MGRIGKYTGFYNVLMNEETKQTLFKINKSQKIWGYLKNVSNYLYQ